MRRIAFFVEGASEMLFVEKLLTEVASIKNIVVNKTKIRGGGKSGKHPKQFREVGAVKEATNETFYAIIYDCGGDDLVNQRIREEHQNLTDIGYEVIVGVRDVRPRYKKDEVERLKNGMAKVVDKALAPVVFVLSTMEVEAWFLAEYTHFERLHPELTPQLISDNLGFDPREFCPADREHPAADLVNTYRLKGIEYDKFAVENTINVLDFAYIYSEMADSIPELNLLSSTVDAFLTVPLEHPA